MSRRTRISPDRRPNGRGPREKTVRTAYANAGGQSGRPKFHHQDAGETPAYLFDFTGCEPDPKAFRKLRSKDARAGEELSEFERGPESAWRRGGDATRSCLRGSGEGVSASVSA